MKNMILEDATALSMAGLPASALRLPTPNSHLPATLHPQPHAGPSAASQSVPAYTELLSEGRPARRSLGEGGSLRRPCLAGSARRSPGVDPWLKTLAAAPSPCAGRPEPVRGGATRPKLPATSSRPARDPFCSGGPAQGLISNSKLAGEPTSRRLAKKREFDPPNLKPIKPN